MSRTLLSPDQVIKRLYPEGMEPKDARSALKRLASKGMLVGGQWIRLAATRCPGGVCYRLSDVEQFEAAVADAAGAVGRQRTPPSSPAPASLPPSPSPMRSFAQIAEPPKEQFERCPDSEIGKYPTARRGSPRQLRLAGGGGGSHGRHIGEGGRSALDLAPPAR